MTGDKIVGLIGLVMALILILRNGALKHLPRKKALILVTIWLAAFVIVALAFNSLRPNG